MTEPPVRTPAGSAKSLQLTPIWEEVVRNQRVPPNVGVKEVLREIQTRLRAGEWEVRQHALRVLSDVLPLAGELAEAAELQAALVVNLGSPAPGVRRAAREALGRLLQHIRKPEEDLLQLLQYSNDENVTLGIIIALPDLMRPFLVPNNGRCILSSHCLSAVVTYLMSRVSTPIFRDASVDALLKIRDMCGEAKFEGCLEHLTPDPETMQLLTLNLDDSGVNLRIPQLHVNREKEGKVEPNWSDFSDGDCDENVANSVTTYDNTYNLKFQSRCGSSEDVSDGTDDTYTMESSEGGKVVLETEIRFSEEKAFTMRIMEEDNKDMMDGAESALVMAVVPSSDEDVKRTPRRVRFGGEVVKLCTPESDTADVRIEIQDVTGKTVESVVIDRGPRASMIPLPISPVTSIPQAPSESSKFQATATPTSTSLQADKNKTAPMNPTVKDLSVSGNIVSPEVEPGNVVSSSYTTASDDTKCTFRENNISPCADQQSPLNITEQPITESGVGFSSSSSDSPEEIIAEFSSDIWSWQCLGLLNDRDMEILRTKDDWKEELAVLEQLPRILMSKEVQERLSVTSTDTLCSLIRYLLEYCRPQTVEVALCAVGQLVQILSDSTAQACLPELVSGLCRHVGGSAAVAVKMAAANVLRLIFSRQLTSDVLDVILSHRCLYSPSSKMRENSLLVLLQAQMTFPSTTFPARRLLEAGCRSVADPRRRVRHAALEILAVLAQFVPSHDILECASKFGDSRLVSAVSARLTRRSLPSVSADGLVLYALQIPSARRLGHTGPPQGADVDWVLGGTGSLSTGSARSRGQLQAAQGSRWGADNNVVRKAARENPWTAQKHRTEDALAWALVPVSDLEEGVYGRGDGGYLGGIKPLYIKLAATDDAVRSQRYAVHRVADATAVDSSIRVLTPSILRRRTEPKISPWTENRIGEAETTELRRIERVAGRKLKDPPRPVLVASSAVNHNTPPAALFLPSIHLPEKSSTYGPDSSPSGTLPGMKSRLIEPAVPAQLVSLAKSPQTLSQSLPAVPRAIDSALSSRTAPHPDSVSLFNESRNDSQEKLFRTREQGVEQRVAMASAPAAIPTAGRKNSSSSSTTDSTSAPPPVNGPLEVSSISYRTLNEGYNQKVKAKRKLQVQTGNGISGGKVASGPHKFPDTLKPFERPKEGLDMCFSQLEAQQWEVTVQGLTSLVRLVRHHPTVAAAHIHALSTALARQIRNLRSQVSRTACVAAGEMFTLLKKTMEPEMEEVAGALFHRAADTNRFIRADSNEALDAMVDSIAPVKTVPVVLARGAGHPNAIVRTSAARLLLRVTERLGPEKVLNMPKEIRDKMLQTSANLLTEGRLETRSFTKQLFRTWSGHADFGGIMLEAIPANVMRHISKTLATLRT